MREMPRPEASLSRKTAPTPHQAIGRTTSGACARKARTTSGHASRPRSPASAETCDTCRDAGVECEDFDGTQGACVRCHDQKQACKYNGHNVSKMAKVKEESSGTPPPDDIYFIDLNVLAIFVKCVLASPFDKPADSLCPRASPVHASHHLAEAADKVGFQFFPMTISVSHL